METLLYSRAVPTGKERGRMNQYPENEYSHTHNTSMAGKLIQAQGEQIRETPAEYLARKFDIRGDAGGYRRKSSD